MQGRRVSYVTGLYTWAPGFIALYSCSVKQTPQAPKVKMPELNDTPDDMEIKKNIYKRKHQCIVSRGHKKGRECPEWKFRGVPKGVHPMLTIEGRLIIIIILQRRRRSTDKQKDAGKRVRSVSVPLEKVSLNCLLSKDSLSPLFHSEGDRIITNKKILEKELVLFTLPKTTKGVKYQRRKFRITWKRSTRYSLLAALHTRTIFQLSLTNLCRRMFRRLFLFQGPFESS